MRQKLISILRRISNHTKLAGKSVNFKIKIVDIKELVLPELNDEFASNLGADLKDLDSLKNELKNAITSQEEKRIDNELKQRLLEKISEVLISNCPRSWWTRRLISPPEDLMITWKEADRAWKRRAFLRQD